MIARSTISLRDTIIKSCSSENYIQADEPNIAFYLCGRGVELLIDSLSLALNNQVRIFANLLCDVGVRYPAAFAVTQAVT